MVVLPLLWIYTVAPGPDLDSQKVKKCCSLGVSDSRGGFCWKQATSTAWWQTDKQLMEIRKLQKHCAFQAGDLWNLQPDSITRTTGKRSPQHTECRKGTWPPSWICEVLLKQGWRDEIITEVPSHAWASCQRDITLSASNTTVNR